MDIITDYAKRLVTEEYRARNGYPDRVGEIATLILEGSATNEELREMLDIIDEVQTTWTLEVEE